MGEGAEDDLTKLSHAEKDALILALLRQLAAAEARIAALEARLAALTGPAKTPDNSSKPPSQGQKPDCPPADRARRKSRPVPYTNNISERHLRPSVIFRKVTNGFRCEWGAETYAASAPSSAPQKPTAHRFSTPSASRWQPNHPWSLPAQGGQRRPTYFNIGRDISVHLENPG